MMIASVACGEPKPPACPTIPESGEWDMDWELKFDMHWEIMQLLRDPDSFQEVRTLSRRAYAVQRPDGTEYYGTIEIDFRAANAFGGMVPGYAKVELNEDEEGVCHVVNAYLIDR